MSQQGDAPDKERGGGYEKRIFAQQGVIADFVCSLCDRVSKNAVEVTCKAHSGDADADTAQEDNLVFCKRCLKAYLSESGGRCPVTSKRVREHKCEYNDARTTRKQILKLAVSCPNNTSGRDTGSSAGEDEMPQCEWQGTLRELRTHLATCANRRYECPYREMGCRYRGPPGDTQHEETAMAAHLSLLHAALMRERAISQHKERLRDKSTQEWRAQVEARHQRLKKQLAVRDANVAHLSEKLDLLEHMVHGLFKEHKHEVERRESVASSAAPSVVSGIQSIQSIQSMTSPPQTPSGRASPMPGGIRAPAQFPNVRIRAAPPVKNFRSVPLSPMAARLARRDSASSVQSGFSVNSALTMDSVPEALPHIHDHGDGCEEKMHQAIQAGNYNLARKLSTDHRSRG